MKGKGMEGKGREGNGREGKGREGVEKLRGLKNTRGQILKFSIEMAGHLYNRAGATAQPVITYEQHLKKQVSPAVATEDALQPMHFLLQY